MKRISITWALLWVIMASIYAQNNKQQVSRLTPTDSLERVFNDAASDQERVTVLFNEKYNNHVAQADKGIALYQKGYELAQRLDNKLVMAKMAYYIGALYAVGKSDEGTAFQYYQKALKISEEINDYKGCELAHYAIGLVYDHQGFRDKMYKSFLKALENSEKVATPSRSPFYTLIGVYTADKQMDKALEVAKRAVAMMQKPGISAFDKIVAYHGMLAVLKGMPNQAKNVAFYTQKVASILENEPMEQFSNDLAIIMEICIRVKRYDLAIKYADYILSKKDDSKVTKISHAYAHQLLAEMYQIQKKYLLSIEHYKKYMELTTKLNLQTATEDAGRKVIKAEAERDLLLKQNEVDTQRWFAISGFCIAIVLLLGCLVVYHFYKREQKTKQELTQLNATKDKLFAILSHDLRSPVGALENSVMLTNWGALTQEEFVQSTQNLGQAVGHVRTMLDNLLQWSISQMGGIKPIKEQIRLLELLESQIQVLSPASTKKSIQIINSVPDDAILLADKNHLAVIVRNLLQNAIKFTHSGGNISIKANRHQDKLLVEIRDTGIGMSKERLANLFRLSTSSSKLGTDLEQGTGLGLVLVKELVEANQGSIEVNSEPNQGTLFKLYFRTSLAAALS